MFGTRSHFSNRIQVLVICGLIFFLLFFISFFDLSRSTYILNSTKTRLKSLFTGQSDYTHLINMNFTFKKLPLVCSEDEDILLILVHSATDHFNNRRVIRETWGQKDDDIRLLFLVGSTEDTAVNEKLEEEYKQHDDILEGNFLDTYHNLTYKHVMGLKYFVYHCPKPLFVLKVDDDVFINIPTLKTFIRSYVCDKGMPTQILCSRLKNPAVLRSGKWATSLEDFPESHYPNHCGGFTILYPQNVIYSLYSEAQRTKFFWVDDVFVSGICAKKSNISHIGIEDLVLSNENFHNIVDLSFTNITRPFLVGRINLNEKQIRSLWYFVTNNLPKSVLDYVRYD